MIIDVKRVNTTGNKIFQFLTEKHPAKKMSRMQQKGKVKKHVGGFPGIGCDMTLTPDKKTDGRWSEVMNKIKSELPERYAKNVDNTDMSGHSWKG